MVVDDDEHAKGEMTQALLNQGVGAGVVSGKKVKAARFQVAQVDKDEEEADHQVRHTKYFFL